MRAELEPKLGTLERQLAEARKKIEELEARTENKPEPTEHTASTGGDVRKLRSGIPFITEVKVDKGGLAAVERVDEASYTASYKLQVKVPAPATDARAT